MASFIGLIDESLAKFVQVWNTSNGSKFAEWREIDDSANVSFSCMACSFVGKMVCLHLRSIQVDLFDMQITIASKLVISAIFFPVL